MLQPMYFANSNNTFARGKVYWIYSFFYLPQVPWISERALMVLLLLLLLHRLQYSLLSQSRSHSQQHQLLLWWGCNPLSTAQCCCQRSAILPSDTRNYSQFKQIWDHLHVRLPSPSAKDTHSALLDSHSPATSVPARQDQIHMTRGGEGHAMQKCSGGAS